MLAIVGAIVVSVKTGDILCLGNVPDHHIPASAIRLENEADLFWAIKGAGTNFSIVVSVTFKTCAAPTYLTRSWIMPLKNDTEAQNTLHDFDTGLARDLHWNSSADVYLFTQDGKLHMSLTRVELASRAHFPDLESVIVNEKYQGSELKIVNGMGLFDTELYMFGMHGGHAGGKTSAFKRCIFLKDIGDTKLASRLIFWPSRIAHHRFVTFTCCTVEVQSMTSHPTRPPLDAETGTSIA